MTLPTFVFPGEGRAPVGKQKLACAAPGYRRHRDWTPAPAGEQLAE
jgi:hypothetical protein